MNLLVQKEKILFTLWNKIENFKLLRIPKDIGIHGVIFCLTGYFTFLSVPCSAIDGSDTALTGLSVIYLKNETDIRNVRIISATGRTFEYEKEGAVKKISADDVARMEGKETVLFFDSLGNALLSQYDILVGKGKDTLECLITGIKGNYLHCCIKGRIKCGYILLSSVSAYFWNSREKTTKIDIGEKPSEKRSEIIQDTITATPADSTISQNYVPAATPQATDISGGSVEADVKSDTGSAGDNCYTSYLQGQRDAKEGSSDIVWGGAGFVAQCCGCPWAVPIVHLHSKHNPKTLPPQVNGECYKLGYGNQSKQNNILAASYGSAIFTIAVGLTYFIFAIAATGVN